MPGKASLNEASIRQMLAQFKLPGPILIIEAPMLWLFREPPRFTALARGSGQAERRQRPKRS